MSLRQILTIVVIGLLLFVPFTWMVHLFDWDEINFAESAREMLVTGDYGRVRINYKPFWEKPPLFMWMQALSMQVFGVGEFAARLPNALIGVASLLVVFRIGRKVGLSNTMGWYWVMAMAGSILPHVYWKSGIIDPLFNLLIFIGIHQLAMASMEVDKNSKLVLKRHAWSGVAIGLAVLSKGPVAVLIWLLCALVFWVRCGLKPTMRFAHILVFGFIALLVSSIWFLPETLKNGTWFLREFIFYQIRLFQTQDAGHGGPLYYHWVVVLLGCWPASIFLFRGWKSLDGNLYPERHYSWWMKNLLLVVLILFSIVQTKIVHYSSLAYFPLGFLAARGMQRFAQGQEVDRKRDRWLKVGVGVVGLLYGLLVTAIPQVFAHKDYWLDKVKDPFVGNSLAQDLSWGWVETLPGIFLLAVVVATMVLWRKRRLRAVAMLTLFAGVGLWLQLLLVALVPKIEQFSQGGAIQFYEQKQNEDCYVETVGFKSYGHLFYTRKRWDGNDSMVPRDTILSGKVDKPVYIVLKSHDMRQIREYFPNWIKVGEQGGFSFYKKP